MILGNGYVRKIENIVAAIYCETIPGIGDHKHGLVFVSKQDDELHYNAKFTIESSHEVIKVLYDRD